jgi:hypothetical protein
MAYAFVFLVAVAVGVGVYVTTVRSGRPVTQGFGSATEPEVPESGAYVPVTAGPLDWQSRLTGFLGLVIAVVVGAVLLAFTLYAGVEWFVRFAADAVGGD